jgi:ribosome biogenesis GTPase
MYPLAGGGAVIDTPGIKGFGLIDIDEAELWHYFPEMMRVAPACRFYNCTHTHEPVLKTRFLPYISGKGNN